MPLAAPFTDQFVMEDDRERHHGLRRRSFKRFGGGDWGAGSVGKSACGTRMRI